MCSALRAMDSDPNGTNFSYNKLILLSIYATI
jgi:hypothetical protein